MNFSEVVMKAKIGAYVEEEQNGSCGKIQVYLARDRNNTHLPIQHKMCR
jgi:hypothetical protein